ncbi:hypothetical protein BGZ92_001784, partial [Podila epicladia]
TCGSTFPDVCQFPKTSLYTCSAEGATPTNETTCNAGCEVSTPDDRCVSRCAQQAKDAAGAIDSVVRVLRATSSAASADEVATLNLPPFFNLLTELSTSLLNAANDDAALSAISASAKNTANGAFMVLQGALKQKLFQNATRDSLIPANTTEREKAIASLSALVTCTASTKIDCAGLTKLYKSFVDVATPLAAKYPDPMPDQREGKTGTAKMSEMLADAVTGINTAIEKVDPVSLKSSGLLLNKLIGVSSNKKYGPTSQTMILVYDSAGYAAECAGLNVTDWRDVCKTFGLRTSGFLGDFIQMVQNFLGQVPLIGPLVVDPVLTELKKLVIDAQTGAATAIGGALSAIEAVLSILSITGVPDNTNPIRDFVLNTVGIRDVPGECGKPDACQGVIMATKMIVAGAYKLLNTLGIPAMVLDPLKSALDEVLKGLNGATAGVIKSAADILKTAIGIAKLPLSILPNGAGDKAAQALNTIVNGLDAILTCWINNPKV